MIYLNDAFSSYNNIYTPSFIVHPHKTNGTYHITLTEDDKTATLKKLEIYNVPQKTILLPLCQYSELNVGNTLKKIFNDTTGVFMCCDYVVITINDDKLYYIFIEMKSNKPDNSAVKKQFKGATCFIEYSNAIIEQFYGITSLKSVSLNMRYYLVYQGILNKKATKLGRDKRLSSPENFCRHPVGNDREASIPFGVFLG
jgi:hypothetical protein